MTTLADQLAQGDLTYLSGFGAPLASEALPGALPVQQNTPREVPYSLIAEQINGTGFTVHRHENRRVWLYRIRPAVVASDYHRTDLPGFAGRFDDFAAHPQIRRFGPLPQPEAPTDFLHGLITFAGAGSPETRSGMAIHLYAANKDMGDQGFANHDGDLFVAPWEGRLRVRTELGVLEVGVGEFVVIPRAIRFSVSLPDGHSRGFVGEVFDSHFQLPERGPVGANGMADERHFLAPTAAFEDRAGSFRIVTKYAGVFWEAEATHSPFDVVAWHGNYVPYKYPLEMFSSLWSAAFDHPDPSILTVLTVPTDGRGRSALDVAVFAPRWDPTEHTFRPPYYHRNSAIEFNMVIRSTADDGPFVAGAFTYTPYLTPHGVSRKSWVKGTEATDEPMRVPDDSLWLQFESAYLLKLAPRFVDSHLEDPHYLQGFRGFGSDFTG